MFNLTEARQLPRLELLSIVFFHTESDVVHFQARAGGRSFIMTHQFYENNNKKTTTIL